MYWVVAGLAYVPMVLTANYALATPPGQAKLVHRATHSFISPSLKLLSLGVRLSAQQFCAQPLAWGMLPHCSRFAYLQGRLDEDISSLDYA